jgi:hypothetical protein
VSRIASVLTAWWVRDTDSQLRSVRTDDTPFLANTMDSLPTVQEKPGEYHTSLTLIAWLSTSGCQTGSQKITREAEVRFLLGE